MHDPIGDQMKALERASAGTPIPHNHAPRWMRDFDGTLALDLHGVEKGHTAAQMSAAISDMTVTFSLAPIAKAEDGTIVHEPIPEGEHGDITLSLGQLQNRTGEQFDDLVATLSNRALSTFYINDILKFSSAPRWARHRCAALQDKHGDLCFLKAREHFLVQISDEDYAALDAAGAALA